MATIKEISLSQLGADPREYFQSAMQGDIVQINNGGSHAYMISQGVWNLLLKALEPFSVSNASEKN